MEISSSKSLPENAYRSLKPGETYEPIVPAASQMKEFTPRSVTLGIVMAAVFSAAAAFLGLKVGQVFEAAIPIAILAVGFGYAFRRRSTLLENVIVQSVGAASGLVVAGAIFTLPALFILDLPVDLFKLFLVSLLGGVLGIAFLVPLRRHFVKEMHGEFPFPEATATTEVLVAGEAGGKQAKVLVAAALIGGIFDFLILHLQAFAEVFTTRSIGLLDRVAERSKIVFKIDVLSSVDGARLHHRPQVLRGHLRGLVPLLVPPRSPRVALRRGGHERHPAGHRRCAHLRDGRRGGLPRVREAHRHRRHRRGRHPGNPQELAGHREGVLLQGALRRPRSRPRERPSGPTAISR